MYYLIANIIIIRQIIKIYKIKLEIPFSDFFFFFLLLYIYKGERWMSYLRVQDALSAPLVQLQSLMIA